MISFLILMGIVVCFSAILALALNFQWGLGGMVNFGLTGFYALGAYAAALLMLKSGANTFVATVGAMAIEATDEAADFEERRSQPQGDRHASHDD